MLSHSATARARRTLLLAGALLSCTSCRKDDTGVISDTAGSAAARPELAAATSGQPAPRENPAQPVRTAFTETEPPAVKSAAPSQGCSVDRVGDQAPADVSSVSRKAETRLLGWAADQATKTVPPVVVIELDGPKRWFAAAARTLERPDVAQALDAPALVASGWELVADFSGVEPGTYEVRIFEVTSGGFPLVCDPKRHIEIK